MQHAAHVTSMGELDSRPIGTGDVGPVTKQIQALYFEVVTGNNEKYMDWCTSVTPGGG